MGSESRPGSKAVKAILYPLIAFTGLVILTWPVWGEILRRWFVFEQAYSHGLLIFVVAVALVIRNLIRIQPVLLPSYAFLGAFLGLLSVYVLGHVLIIQAFQQLMLLPLFWSVLALFWGWRQAKHFLVPLALIFLAIPIWEHARMPLQMVTAEVNHLALGLIGIEFVIDGLYVQLPGIGIFEIARGCSGLNYLLIGLTLGLLLGEQHQLSVRDRALLLAASGALSLFANWLRVLIIIYVGYATNMESSLIKDHATFGWVVFAVSMVPLFWFGGRLRPGHPPQKTDLRAESNRKGVVALVPVLVLTATGIVLVAPPSSADRDPSVDLAMDPLPNEQWVPLFQKKLGGWQPEVRNADEQWVKTFGQSSEEQGSRKLLVGLYTYHYQRPGAELVQYGNNLYAPSQFRVAETWPISSAGTTMQGSTVVSRRSADRLHLMRGYFVNGRWYGDAQGVKTGQVGSLFSGNSHAALLVVGLACDDCDPAEVFNDVTDEIMPEAKRALNAYYRKP